MIQNVGRLGLQLLPLLTFFMAGVFMRRPLLRQWQGNRDLLREFQRGVNAILMTALLPAIAFLSMARVPLALGWQLVWVPVLGLTTALLALVLTRLMVRLPWVRPHSDTERRTFDMLVPWSNTVIVGLPTVATLLSPDLLFVPFLETSFVWTLLLGPLIVQRGRRDRFSALLWPLLRSSWFWTIPAGLLWAILKLPLGGVGLAILERAREAFLALGLLVVGLGFDPARLHPQHTTRLPLAAIGVGGMIKLLVCPLLAFELAHLVRLPGAVPQALALVVATPSSLTAYIIGEREGLDVELMSFVFALYSVAFFATIVLVFNLLKVLS